jgi:hypothetical protein
MMREGPFWDVMAGHTVPPPAAVTLGWQLIAVDPDAGTIEVAFRAAEQFLNPWTSFKEGSLRRCSMTRSGQRSSPRSVLVSSHPLLTSMCSSCGPPVRVV